MRRSHAQLRDDALAIWRAGVDAVDSQRLVADIVRREDGNLIVGGHAVQLAGIRRVVVVGAGKAGAGMSAGLEQALGEELMAEKNLDGWVNVPSDCVRKLSRITLHPARPAGVNEPTEAGVEGTRRILQAVESAARDDLCFCLISGGGSALLPAPVEEISLADKLAITKHLSAAGANIQQLNTVRRQLSRIKGGGLARVCGAGRTFTLIISDVIGDPLDVIASGPTVEDRSTPLDALKVLEMFPGDRDAIPAGVVDYLSRAAATALRPASNRECEVNNIIVGNNAVAVDAAGVEAERRGYSHAMVAARSLEGPADEVGRHLAEMAIRMREEPGPDCLITGGEPVVELVPASRRGLGGRNQQLVLAALEYLLAKQPGAHPAEALRDIALLSGGTDGEDGPTDAAGAFVNEEIAAAMHQQGLVATDFLAANDSYHFFEPLGGLIRTGPTHTNVCDVRVVVVSRG